MPGGRMETILSISIPLSGFILSVPLILNKVPPNSIYGVRTHETLSDATVWYRVNTLFGCCLLVASIIGFGLWIGFRRYNAVGPGLILAQGGVALVAAAIAWVYMKTL
jgi:hypothetical protein